MLRRVPDPDLAKRLNEINAGPSRKDEATREALKAKPISAVDRWAPIIQAAVRQDDAEAELRLCRDAIWLRIPLSRGT